MDIDIKWKNKLNRMDEEAFGSLAKEVNETMSALELFNEPSDKDMRDIAMKKLCVLKNVAREIALRINSSEYLSDRLKKD